MFINSELVELVETEIRQSNQKNYQKLIPINDYSYETKLALDHILEKYGGFIYRNDQNIKLVINFSNQSVHVDNFNQKEAFNEDILKRIDEIEKKIEQLLLTQNNYINETNKNYFSYLAYFKNETKDTLRTLANEVINNK